MRDIDNKNVWGRPRYYACIYNLTLLKVLNRKKKKKVNLYNNPVLVGNNKFLIPHTILYMYK